jgi:hypothetical protein
VTTGAHYREAVPPRVCASQRRCSIGGRAAQPGTRTIRVQRRRAAARRVDQLAQRRPAGQPIVVRHPAVADDLLVHGHAAGRPPGQRRVGQGVHRVQAEPRPVAALLGAVGDAPAVVADLTLERSRALSQIPSCHRTNVSPLVRRWAPPLAGQHRRAHRSGVDPVTGPGPSRGPQWSILPGDGEQCRRDRPNSRATLGSHLLALLYPAGVLIALGWTGCRSSGRGA